MRNKAAGKSECTISQKSQKFYEKVRRSQFERQMKETRQMLQMKEKQDADRQRERVMSFLNYQKNNNHVQQNLGNEEEKNRMGVQNFCYQNLSRVDNAIKVEQNRSNNQDEYKMDIEQSEGTTLQINFHQQNAINFHNQNVVNLHNNINNNQKWQNLQAQYLSRHNNQQINHQILTKLKMNSQVNIHHHNRSYELQKQNNKTPIKPPIYNIKKQQPILNIRQQQPIPRIQQQQPIINIRQQQPIPNIKNRSPSPIKPIINKVQEEYQDILRTHKVYLRIRNYIILEKILGQGTYAKVYLAVNCMNKKKYAVKELTELQENQVKTLKNEKVQNSPYIIKLDHVERHHHNGKVYLFLEYCARNLKQQMQKVSYDRKLMLEYFDHLVKGMDVLLGQNIIHRDLKFQNILISEQFTDNGVLKIAKITDFGLAKSLGCYSQVASLRCGTPYTMAPQIFTNNSVLGKPMYNQKCDIWSLGVLLHEMLYEKHPFDMNVDRFYQMRRVKINKTNGYLDVLIDRALVWEPDRRIDWKEFIKIYHSGKYPSMSYLPKQQGKKAQVDNFTNLKKNQQEKELFSNFNKNMQFGKEEKVKIKEIDFKILNKQEHNETPNFFMKKKNHYGDMGINKNMNVVQYANDVERVLHKKLGFRRDLEKGRIKIEDRFDNKLQEEKKRRRKSEQSDESDDTKFKDLRMKKDRKMQVVNINGNGMVTNINNNIHIDYRNHKPQIAQKRGIQDCLKKIDLSQHLLNANNNKKVENAGRKMNNYVNHGKKDVMEERKCHGQNGQIEVKSEIKGWGVVGNFTFLLVLGFLMSASYLL